MRLNYAAIFVAALAAFVASFLWYLALGNELAEVSKPFAEMQGQRPHPWKMAVVFGQCLVVAFVVAYVIGLRPAGWTSALWIGFLLWLGLCAAQWVGSMVWEKVPLKMAAIHAGDWLLKLLLISAIVGAWRKR